MALRTAKSTMQHAVFWVLTRSQPQGVLVLTLRITHYTAHRGQGVGWVSSSLCPFVIRDPSDLLRPQPRSLIAHRPSGMAGDWRLAIGD